MTILIIAILVVGAGVIVGLMKIANAVKGLDNGSDAERQKVMDKLDALDDDIKSTVKNNLPKMDNQPPPPPPLPFDGKQKRLS